jgi:hypothetical protein
MMNSHKETLKYLSGDQIKTKKEPSLVFDQVCYTLSKSVQLCISIEEKTKTIIIVFKFHETIVTTIIINESSAAIKSDRNLGVVKWDLTLEAKYSEKTLYLNGKFAYFDFSQDPPVWMTKEYTDYILLTW